MGKFEDLTGQKFGKLTVIERCENYITPKGQHNTQWLCKCDCGNETKVRARNLKNGKTKSCGHCNDIKPCDKFGKLTVIERCENYITQKGLSAKQYFCECECGNKVKIRGSNLKSGSYKSCGHCNNINPGDRFGSLTVIKRCEDYVAPKGQHYIRWVCKCDCGNETKVVISKLKNGNTRSCGHCNDIEFINPYDGKKYESSVGNICKECGFRHSTISSRLKRGFTFEEAAKIKSIVRINKIYKITFNYKYFEGNLKEICEYFNKDCNQVYEFMVYNRTLEWALEHSSDVV